MKNLFFAIAMLLTIVSVRASAKTLVVYYSYTGNCHEIVQALKAQVACDVVRIEPADKDVKYDANGYAIGTELLNQIKAAPGEASSYPAIDPVAVDLAWYDTYIIVTPLWWSQMAAIMQSFLFAHGTEMSGKRVGLVVSSHSSSISQVVADCRRLVPDGVYFGESLWINNGNRSETASLIGSWLETIGYSETTGLRNVCPTDAVKGAVYTLGGVRLNEPPAKGMYVENGRLKIIGK